jgi:hypothetical protein
MYAQATCYGLQGSIYYLNNDFQAAYQINQQALCLVNAYNDPWLEAKFRLQLGTTANVMPSNNEAAQLFKEGLELAANINAMPLVLAALVGFTMLPQFRTVENNQEVSSLLEFIRRHSAATYETQNEVGRLMAQPEMPAVSEPELAKAFLIKEFGTQLEYLFAGASQ